MNQLVALDESELEEIFSRSSGPGGQKVNKASSRVTLRHRPTNLFVTVQDSRSQAVNRQLARQRLLALIQRHQRAQAQAARQAKEKRRRQSSPRPLALKRRILEAKRRRSTLKQHRARVSPQD